MRLTLRTLLAYMDDILEPAQAKEIGQKISESAFATELTKRIGEVMKRRRISAPELDSKGQGLDPNLVSEYLDNSLPPETVAEIEKICLDSDIQLAEAAASHQILTLVMGDPVDVPESTRHRMYALGPVGDAETAAPVAKVEVKATEPGPNVAIPQAQPARDFQSTVPEYLKRKPLWKRMAPFLLVTTVIVGWLALVLSDPSIVPKSKDPDQLASADTGEPADPSGDATDEGAVDEDSATPPKGQLDNKLASDGIDPPPPADEPGTGLSSKPATTVPVVNPSDPKTADATLTPDATDNSTNVPSDTGTASQPVTSSPTDSTAGNTTTTPSTAPPIATTGAPVTDPADMLPLVNETTDGVVIGHDPDSGEWIATSKDVRFPAGSRLAVPEPFIGRLRVEGVECQIEFVGGTRAIYLGETEAGPAGFDISSGRLVFAGVGLPIQKPDSDEAFVFGLKMGGRLFRAELMTDDSRCGFEITPRQPTEPLQDFGDYRCSARVIVAAGALRISDGVKVTTVKAGQELTLLSDTNVVDGEATGDETANANPAITQRNVMPEWLQPASLQASIISNRYRKQFLAVFTANESVVGSVAPLIRDPDARLAEMAVNCLALIEQVTYMVSTLQQSDHAECRVAAINGIRDWLPQAPENDMQLREELNRQFPDKESSMIHRMLWGYGGKDATNRFVALSLIDALAHEHIAVRELGFYFIRQLSTRNFDYRPNASPRERAAAIGRLRDQVLEEEQLPGAITTP